MMRTPLGLYLQAGLLFRRYLNFPLCRAARSDLYLRGGVGAGAGELRGRGLMLGWLTSTPEAALLDTPHTKLYRLAFDTRVYSSKSCRRLQARTQAPLPTSTFSGGAGGWAGLAFGVEFSAWGERTALRVGFWSRLDGALRSWARSATLGRGSVLGGWGSFQPWQQLAWAWALPQALGGVNVWAGGTVPFWEGSRFETEEARGEWVDHAALVEGPEFVSAHEAHILGSVGALVLAPAAPAVVVDLAPRSLLQSHSQVRQGSWMYALERLWGAEYPQQFLPRKPLPSLLRLRRLAWVHAGLLREGS